jgi:hypothetical protein
MAEGALARAVNTAWSVYIVNNSGIHAADARRCTIERYLASRLQAGETEPEELAVDGLAYLRKLDHLENREFG